MKINVNSIVRNLENVSDLCASDIEVHEESTEMIIRFKDGNNFTISIYFTDSEMILGYLLEDGTYKWYCTSKLEQFKSFSDLMFRLGLKLYQIENHIENYVIC